MKRSIFLVKELRNLSFGKKDRFNLSDLGWKIIDLHIQAALGPCTDNQE